MKHVCVCVQGRILISVLLARRLDALGTDTALSIFQSETRRQSFLMRKASSVLGGSDDDDEEISVYDTAGAGDADTQVQHILHDTYPCRVTGSCGSHT